MKTPILHVYIMFAEMRGIYDTMNIKIGVSDDPEKRLKGVQTGCPGDVHLIRSFPAGRDAFIHEGHFHKLYKEFSTGGEWFEFDSDYFVEKVLPEMVDYFGKIEVNTDHNISTKLSLGELLNDVNCAEYEIDRRIGDSYANRKIVQLKLKKAQTLVDDNQKQKFQVIIDNIQSVIDAECIAKRREDQEAVAIKNLKRKAYNAEKRLETIAMGMLIGMK